MFNKYIFAFFVVVILGLFLFYKKKSVAEHGTLQDASLYKIVEPMDYDKENKRNCILLSLLDIDSGFMHASYGSQVKETMTKFFKDKNEALALELDLEVLKQNGTELRPEANKPGGTIYPHFYGTQAIPARAVKNVLRFRKNAQGVFEVVKK